MTDDQRDDGPSDVPAPDEQASTAAPTSVLAATLVQIGRAGVYWREMAERLERERNEAFGEVKLLTVERDHERRLRAQCDAALLRVAAERDRLGAEHADCSNLSHAEASRIFEEARQMRDERDEWKDTAEARMEFVSRSQAHVRRYQAERDALRAALTFYATPGNWSEGFWTTRSNVIRDRGDRARRALAPGGAGEEE